MEAPDLYTTKPPGFRHVVTGRYSLLLGTAPVITNVQVLRVTPADVDEVVEDVRRRIREAGHRRTRWWLPGATPPAVLERLEEHRILPDEREPLLAGMVMAREPAAVDGIEARRAATLEEWQAGVEIEVEAFGLDASTRAELLAAAARRYEEEHVSGQAPRFLAFLDGGPVATAVAITATHGLFLVGGATSPAARGRGAYRALVRARWDFAVERRTPGLVVHAGRHSRPILERLGFRTVTTSRLHVDATL